MATIQIKRGQSTNASTLNLQPGELALTLDKGQLYGGLASGKVLLNPEPPVKSVNGATGAVIVSSITGNAGSATKLANARQINLSGAVTGSANFDGSANVTISTSINASSIGTIDGGTF